MAEAGHGQPDQSQKIAESTPQDAKQYDENREEIANEGATEGAKIFLEDREEQGRVEDQEEHADAEDQEGEARQLLP